MDCLLCVVEFSKCMVVLVDVALVLVRRLGSLGQVCDIQDFPAILACFRFS